MSIRTRCFKLSSWFQRRVFLTKESLVSLSFNCIYESSSNFKYFTGWHFKNGPLSFRSSNYIFAQIASIYFNELFIMNLSFKGGTVHLNRSIRIEVIHQNVFSVRSKLLCFWTKFKGLRICMWSDLIFDLRGSQH